MLSSTRRRFLKTTAAATASLAAFRSSLLWAAPALGVQAWSTSKDRKFERITVPQWRPATTNTSGGIQLDPSVRYQKILGFGAAFTDASEPEEVMAILREYHESMGELIFRYEGTLERILANRIMIVFNDPIPCADHTEDRKSVV